MSVVDDLFARELTAADARYRERLSVSDLLWARVGLGPPTSSMRRVSLGKKLATALGWSP